MSPCERWQDPNSAGVSNCQSAIYKCRLQWKPIDEQGKGAEGPGEIGRVRELVEGEWASSIQHQQFSLLSLTIRTPLHNKTLLDQPQSSSTLEAHSGTMVRWCENGVE